MPDGEEREPRPWLPGGGLRPPHRPSLQGLRAELSGFLPKFRAGVLAGWVTQGRIPLEWAEFLAFGFRTRQPPAPPEPFRARERPLPFAQAMRRARVEAGALPSLEAVSYPFLEQLEPGLREYAETQMPTVYRRFTALGGEETRETWWTQRLRELGRQRAVGIQRGTVRGRRLEMKALLPKAAISPSFAAYYKELGEREKKLTAKIRGRRKITTPVAGEDPFLKYLTAYPFTAEYYKARPEEAFRGIIPEPTPEPEPTPYFGYGRYAPPARWLLY